MGSFLLFILMIFLSIIALVGAFIFRFIRLVKKQTSGFNQYQSTPNSSQNTQKDYVDNEHRNSPHQKVFSKDEGEYVEFEEIA